MRVKRILVVDDEEDIREMISINLKKNGYEVLEAEDGRDALKKFRDNDPLDLVLLDIMMPNLDGYDVCKEIRKSGSTIPVVFLTARDSEFDEVLGLELGADDYIKKPFGIKALMSRVKTILRRKEPVSADENKILMEGLEINLGDYSVKVDHEAVFFPRREFELLAFLAAHPNKVYPRDFLLARIWDEDTFVVDRTIDVHIGRIRKKLGSNKDRLKTVVGVGYKFQV